MLKSFAFYTIVSFSVEMLEAFMYVTTRNETIVSFAFEALEAFSGVTLGAFAFETIVSVAFRLHFRCIACAFRLHFVW